LTHPFEEAGLPEHGFIPLYFQVQVAVKQMIEANELKPGDRIPSERELSEQLGVSRMTVRRAIDNLVRLGMLERRSTSGTYVTEPQVVRHLDSHSTRGFAQLWRRASDTVGTRLLLFETGHAPRKVADRLDLRLGQPVFVVRLLRLVSGQPFSIETIYLPQVLVPGLKADDLATDASSLHEVLRARYGIIIVKNNELLSISAASQSEAELLGIQPESPVLLVHSVAFDAADRPVEYVRSVNHPDRVSIRMTEYF